MTKQLAELGGPLERVGHDRAAREGDRGVETALALGNEVGAGRQLAGVSLGEPPQAGRVGRGGESERDRVHGDHLREIGQSTQDVVVTKSIVIYD